jgi:hypothetical protein
MHRRPIQLTGCRERESELGKVVGELLEEIGVVAAKLKSVVTPQGGGQLVEPVQELAGALVGECRVQASC